MKGKNFLKKSFAAGTSIIVALSCLAMAACGGGEESSTHEHTWSTTYSHDGTNHWLTCSGCDEKKNDEPHNYSAGVCTVCGYNDPDYEPPHTHNWSSDWENDAEGHWHECLNGCDEKGSYDAHTVVEGVCTVCGYNDPDYEPPHSHTWADDWSYDATQHWHECTDPSCEETSTPEHHTMTDGVCTVCGYNDPDYNPGSSTPLPAANKIYLVGDSTVCSFNDNYYMPRYGYGTQIVEYFNVTSDQVVNLAMSGRSSLSFLTETNYTTLENSIGEGDYLIIGFGHNDEKDDDATRYTNPVPDYQTATGADGAPSFQYTLYENYVKLAKDAGATPILCTPIVRYSSTADYSGSKIHITEKGDYAAAIKALGEATDTTVIDLTSLTKAVYEADNTAAQYYHAHTTYELDADGITKLPMGRDDTHINKYGAQMVVYQLANALKSTDSTLAAHVKDNIAAPADPSVAVNEGYIKPAYTAPDLSLFTKVTDLAATETTSASSWYRTVVGNIGGTSKYSNYNISYTNNVFTVGVASNNGKFSSDVDGFGTAFMRVDMSTNFTINATATVTNVAAGVANNQSAFGIMLRDDIYRENSGDNYAGKTSPNTNYVAAGVFQTGETIFSRENATLTKGDNTGAVATGATYQMTIERVGQIVNVTVVVNGVTKTKTYTDFDFAAVDNEHMYICLFANRGLTVEFSNVNYKVTGTSQGA